MLTVNYNNVNYVLYMPFHGGQSMIEPVQVLHLHCMDHGPDFNHSPTASVCWTKR